MRSSTSRPVSFVSAFGFSAAASRRAAVLRGLCRRGFGTGGVLRLGGSPRWHPAAMANPKQTASSADDFNTRPIGNRVIG